MICKKCHGNKGYCGCRVVIKPGTKVRLIEGRSVGSNESLQIGRIYEVKKHEFNPDGTSYFLLEDCYCSDCSGHWYFGPDKRNAQCYFEVVKRW